MPEGFSAGQTFQFQVAEAPPIVAATVVPQPTAPVAAVPVMASATVVIAGQPVQQVAEGTALRAGMLPTGTALPAGIKIGTGIGMVHPAIRPADSGMVPPGTPAGGWMVRERCAAASTPQISPHT